MRAQYYLRLVGGAAVIVPDGEVLHTVWLLLQTLGLATDALPSSVNPDVVSLNSEQKLFFPTKNRKCCVYLPL